VSCSYIQIEACCMSSQPLTSGFAPLLIHLLLATNWPPQFGANILHLLLMLEGFGIMSPTGILDWSGPTLAIFTAIAIFVWPLLKVGKHVDRYSELKDAVRQRTATSCLLCQGSQRHELFTSETGGFFGRVCLYQLTGVG